MRAVRPIRTAVIGYGYWGPNLARNAAERPEFDLAVVCERDPAQRRRCQQRHPEARPVAEVDAVLNDDSIEAVIIATPPQTHYPLAKAALEAGKHVLVEKPLATRLDYAYEIADLATATGLVLMPGHTFIYSPAVNAIRDLIRADVLGEIHFITSSRMNLGKYQSDGVVCDLAPHDLSILLYWLDQPVIEVAAAGRSVFQQGVPETAFLTLTFAGGPTANVQISWLAPRKVRNMIIVGSKRMVQYDDTAPDEAVRIYDRGMDVRPPANFGEHQLIYRTGDVVIPRVEPAEPLSLELQDFARAIREGSEPRSNVALGLAIAAAVEAATASLSAGGLPLALAPLADTTESFAGPSESSRREAGRLRRRTTPRYELPRIMSVIGGRPEIIQAAPVSAALAPVAQEVLVHTGQHYDASMSERQILATHLPHPHHNLGVGSRSREEQLAVAQKRIVDLITCERPDAVLVRGDTNATLSGARAASETGVPLVHVEAGLRSHRLDMPEELNRLETDRLADLLLAPTPGGQRNLEAEGVGGVVHITGDPLCDILESWRMRITPVSGQYVLATVHRNYNTDDPERLAAVFACLARARHEVVMPLHPRTRARIQTWELDVPANVRFTDPVPYPRMLALERGAIAIATDSGGVQREAYLWGVRCITLREETEWTDTVETGWNTLVGVDADGFEAALATPLPRERPPLFGDGRAAHRIAELVAEFAGGASAEEVAACAS